MSEDIRELNKKIAPFILLSVALAVPASSADNDNNVQNTKEASTYESRQVMLFYGAPQRPYEQVINKEETAKQSPMVFYGAPQIPDKQMTIKEESKIPPVMAYYAAPSIPTQIEQPEDMSQMRGYKYSVIDDIPEIKQAREKNTSLWERVKKVFKQKNDK